MKVFLLQIALVVVCNETALAEKEIDADSYLGKKAPELAVEGWISDEPLIQKGQFLLIEFWEPGCSACKRAMRALNLFHRQFGDKLVVMGISPAPKKITQKMMGPEFEYYSAFDTKDEMAKAMGVSHVPYVIIINPAGIVVWEGNPIEEKDEFSLDVIKELLMEGDKSPLPLKR